ncbi:TetR/AcrR family transcriptional regulator [Leisingera daeponensis]|uniref:TetR/AcrR family transcriptional regulator n=1 Tax=Leisingera daeponensis TaxID=405746 RepID=UPI001C9703E3|nr:TetR/AcrR family transcriptional regulator [Leisingera daeponensis]MBY6059381.1 TetR family transcriptional regulator [Leisingera daeponensis]
MAKDGQAARAAHTSAPRQMRNGAETKEKILNAAIGEFCEHGYAGASTARITKAAGCNIRMLYHYFENKDGLYLAALTRVYEDLRHSEQATNFWSLPPREGVTALTHFTFDYMRLNQSFPKMIINENINQGRAAQQASEAILTTARPFLENIRHLIDKGHAAGEFSHRPDALHLYLTILALSFIHISNQHTLSAAFDTDLGAETFLSSRKAHVTEVVLAYLTAPRKS